MIGANKILTVSYGTFSCTLEGFDEPFTTMKAIAEYFRDLAAEDRYFGAEPPTPDAEMLHRIAEREIQRRVEAKISENTVVLRQMEAPAAVEPQVARTAVAEPEVVAASLAAEAPAPVEPVAAAAPVAVAPETKPLADAVATAAVVDDSISDKLRRIRAVVANAQTQPAAAAVAGTAFYEDLGGDDVVLPADVAEYAEPMDDDFGFTLDLDPQDLSDVLSLNEPDAVAGSTGEPADEPTLAEAPEAPVAAEAQAGSEDNAQTWDDANAWVEAETAPESVAVTETAPEVEAAPAEDMVSDIAGEDLSLDALQDVLASQEAPAFAVEPAEMVQEVQEDVAAEAVAEEALTEEVVAEEAVAEDDVADDLPTEEAREVSEFVAEAAVWEAIEEAGPTHVLIAEVAETAARSDAEIWDELEHAAHLDDLDEVAAEIDEDAPDFAAEMAEDDLDDEEDDAPMSPLANLIARTRARVEGVRSNHAAREPETVAEAHDFDEIEARDAIFATAAEAEADEAEPEADNDLIAGIEAAIGAIKDHEAVVEAQEEAEILRPAASGKSMLAEDAEEGGDFERLMEEANTKLEGAESRRRFSAISHLKAAVAATVAERILKPKDAPAETIAPVEPEIDRYRDDLSRAVRPRRPEPEGERVTARPAVAMRPAPLVLVSEQRVDREELQPAAIIRPRRVATTLIVGDEDDMNEAEPLSPEDAKSFTEFAERLGARSLAELLEVAAVYTATVEGKNSFSRPHLLRRVNAATGVEDFSREDYLRSFGSLLRQGRIQKVEPGRFSVTDVSPFMTEMRRAAN